MSAKQIRQYEQFKGLQPKATAADVRHEIAIKTRAAQKLLKEIMELEGRLVEMEKN